MQRIQHLILTVVLIFFWSNSISAQSNLALNKPTTTDSYYLTNTGNFAVDGDTISNTSRWLSQNSSWPHSIIIDLQGNYSINKVKFWMGYGGAYTASVTNFTIDYWNGTSWVSVVTRTGNTLAIISENFAPVLTGKIRLNGTSGADNYFRIYDIFISGVNGEIIPPTVPTSLVSTNINPTGFTLSWNASTDNVGVTGYDVYLNGIQYGSTTTNSSSITGLNPMTAYTMTVMAKDAAGNNSAISSGLVVTTTPVKNKPINLTFSALTQSTFTFSWTPSLDNVGVTSYDVYKDGILLGNTLSTSFNLTGLAASTPYAMTVVSKDASGNNLAISDVFNVITNSAFNLTLNGSFEKGTTPWAPYGTCSVKTTKPFAGYYCCYATNGGGTNQTVSNLKPNTSYTVIAQLKTDTGSISMGVKTFGGVDQSFSTTNRTWTRASLTFTTGATNTSAILYLYAPTGTGNTGYGDDYSLAVANPTDTQLPSAPTNLASTKITPTTFTLSWTAATDNVGVYNYEVFQNGISLGIASATSMNIVDLVPSSTNSFQVVARDYCGNSTASSSFNVTTLANTYTSSPNLLGINLRWSFQDYSEDRMYTDVIKMCRLFTAPNLNGGGASVPVDVNGWPTTDFEFVVWAGIAKMNGTYKLSYECANTAATFKASWSGGSLTNKVISGNTVSYDFTVNGSGVTSMLFIFTNTNGGVRNIKLIRPVVPGSTISYPAGTMITDQIKALVSKFSVIRFMDYFATNSNELTTWSQRSLPGYASQHVRSLYSYSWTSPSTGVKTDYYSPIGGCYEDAIRLCNETSRDMWLNIPLKVNDDYITRLAQLLKYGSDGVNPYTSSQANPVYPPLNSGLRVYVEYSNEVWNTAPAFRQGNDNEVLAVAEVNAGGSPLNFDGVVNNGWVWAWRRVGKKTVEISNIFRSIWGDASMMTTIRPVLQGQQGVCSIYALGLIDKVYCQSSTWCTTPHPMNYYIYGAGGSGYYGPNNDPTLSIENVWTSGSMKNSSFMPNMRKESAVAHAFGLKRICYEGGPSMDDDNQYAVTHLDTVKTMTNADPRMKDNMVSHIDNVWSASDGDLFVYYCSTGSEYAWPFTNDLYNLNTPKLQAIDQLNTVNKVAPTICSVPPCILNGTDFEYNWAIGSYPYSSGTVYHIKQNAYLIYMFRVVTPGTYNVSASLNANTGPLSIVVDGVLLGTESVKGTLPSYTMANMQPGLHTVMFKTSTGETEFVTVTINTGAGQKGIITAIDNPQIDKSLSVYPNPANNLLNVNYISDRNAEIKVNILDLSGVMMMNETRTVLTGSNSIQFNTDYLKSGVYILRIQNENTIYNQKVIIKK